MDSASLLQTLDQIDMNLDALEDVLKPILENGLKGASQKLAIFERVKLNVTVVYAIDTLLYSRNDEVKCCSRTNRPVRLPQYQRRQRERAPSFQRVDTSQTILQQDPGS